MNTHCQELLALGRHLQKEETDLSHITRVAVERHLFATCKSLALTYFKYDMRTFALVAREDLTNLQADDPRPDDIFQTILDAFSLDATLGILASGDPYLKWELAGASLPGRNNAKNLFAKHLVKYAIKTQDLLDT